MSSVYENYLEAIEAWQPPDTSAVMQPLALAIRSLKEEDYELAENWVPKDVDDTIYERMQAQMRSARMAEKTVLSAYLRLGYQTQDISITQLRGGQDWTTHDIWAKPVGKHEAVAIDVKNARLPIHGHLSYVEHIVPQFKQDRNFNEVVIVGVLSPYCRNDDFDSPQDTSGKKIIVLGEARWQEIEMLTSRFSTASLDLFINQETEHRYHSNRWQYVLPPWIFNYPPSFYHGSRISLRSLQALEEWPAGKAFRKSETRPALALLLAAGREAPENWKSLFPTWAWDFYRKLEGESQPPTLPLIFLHIISDFTQLAKQDSDEYSPAIYRELLFVDLKAKWRRYPAGLFDPLRSISNLIADLEIIWRKRNTIGLQKFSRFEYRGLGILRGFHQQSETWKTLIAYCGGEVKIGDKKVKCGKPRLVYGARGVKTCDDCGRLICPECNFCKEQCPRRNQSW